MESKISICNMALSLIGEIAIRDFAENNKRARMCDRLYESTRRSLLARFDWSFARRFMKLNQVTITDDIPEGIAVYQLPADCISARDIHPPGSGTKWEVRENKVYVSSVLTLENVYLYYTKDAEDATKFSAPFVDLLALALAIKIAHPLTQDKALVKSLVEQYKMDMYEAWEADANIGSTYKPVDDIPDNDTFVNPDGTIDTDDY